MNVHVGGLDYVAILNQQLTFGPSVRSHTVYIQILDDDSFEKNTENFTVTLSTNIAPRFHLGDHLATLNISDNESESVTVCLLYIKLSLVCCLHNCSCRNWISECPVYSE